MTPQIKLEADGLWVSLDALSQVYNLDLPPLRVIYFLRELGVFTTRELPRMKYVASGEFKIVPTCIGEGGCIVKQVVYISAKGLHNLTTLIEEVDENTELKKFVRKMVSRE